MSRDARKYLRNLKSAPRECKCSVNSEGKRPHGAVRLSVQDRAVLWCLAEYHNPSAHCCWPSVRTISSHCGLSTRRIREILAGLECRGVIQRKPRTRGDGSQTSNLYYFPEIDPPQPVPMMFSAPTHQVERSSADGRGACDAGRAGSENDREGPGALSHAMNRNLSSIEECKEASPPAAGGNHPPTPLKEGGVVNESKNIVDAWSDVCCVLKSDLSSTACFTDLPDEYDRFFRDTWQVGATADRILLRAERPDVAKVGLQKYDKRIKTILKKLFGVAVSGVEILTNESGGINESAYD